MNRINKIFKELMNSIVLILNICSLMVIVLLMVSVYAKLIVPISVTMTPFQHNFTGIAWAFVTLYWSYLFTITIINKNIAIKIKAKKRYTNI